MKRLLIVTPLLFLFSLSSLFAAYEEAKKFVSSMTQIIESNGNYVVIENLSSKVLDNMVTQVKRLNYKYGEIAQIECEKFGKKYLYRHGWGTFQKISDYRGKYICMPAKQYYEYLIGEKTNFLYVSHKEQCKKDEYGVCAQAKEELEKYKYELSQLGDDEPSSISSSIPNNLASIEKKQDTCKSLGFEIGTPPNGECVLKLMELETQVAASTQTIINNNSGSDQATVNALAETQQKMLIQQQSQALINMGAALLNSGQPKINCRQTLTGFSCY